MNKKVLRVYHRAIMRTARLLHGIDRKKVTFVSFCGRSYSDNPRTISERLHELRPDVKQIWFFKEPMISDPKFLAGLPDYITPVSYRGRRIYEELATSAVWVDNFTKFADLIKVPGKQFYIQTWHGDRAIKKICYDMYPDGYRLEEECDLVLTASDFGQKMYRTAFRYKGAYLNEGSPRNDMLVRNDPKQRAAIREKLGIADDTGLLLYAPTYREDAKVITMEDKFDPVATLNALERKTGRRWMMLFRAHYKSDGIDLKGLGGRMRDVTAWDTMSELLLAADCLLTDYSSCAMDFILMDKPAFFYQADYDHYIANRDVYYDPKDAPFMIAYSQAELEKLIAETDRETVLRNCQAMKDYYGYNETGHATDAVCKYIIERLEGDSNA